ncbi:MAG: hypothetical protein ACI4WS_13560, partial [Oscillospiraceae bacterium]
VDITYTENTSADVQNITNNTANVQNVAGNTINHQVNKAPAVGTAKPVDGSFVQGSVDITYTENTSADVQNITNSTANVQNVAGNTVNQQVNEAPSLGAAKPVEGSFVQRSVDITYTENTSADVQNVTNNTANVQNVAGNTVNQQVNEAPAVGAAKPVDGSFAQGSVDITYTENNSADVQNATNNTANVQNVAGNTVNQQVNEAPAVGAAKPVEGSFAQRSVDITYTENNSADVQNITNNTANVQNVAGNTVNQQVNEAPAVGTAKPVDGSFVQQSADITYIENPDASEPAGRLALPRDIRPKGHAEPFYGRRAAQGKSASEAGGADAVNAKRGRIIPAEELPVFSLSVGGAVNAPAAGEQGIPQNRRSPELSHRSDADPDIFRSGQKTGRKPDMSPFGSYRDRLDSKTLETLDSIIKSAQSAKNTASDEGEGAPSGERLPAKVVRRGTAAPAEVWVADAELEFAEKPEQPGGSMLSGTALPRSLGGAEMRILLGQLRNAARMKSAIATEQHEARHISRLVKSVETQEAVRRGEITVSKSGYSFRTIDDGENMVMLIPPAEADRFSAESGYERQLPPIEYKQRPEQEQAEQPSARKPKVINNTQTSVQSVKTAVSGGFENMTREEINRLADMVYDQIQTRVMRERRRIGM